MYIMTHLKSGTVALWAGDAGGLTVMDTAHGNKTVFKHKTAAAKKKKKKA